MAHAARAIVPFLVAMRTVEPLTAQWIHHQTQAAALCVGACSRNDFGACCR